MDKEGIRKYLTANIIDKVVAYIMKDNKCDMLAAMNILYSSPVIDWLQDAETELYVQSPAYVYELMNSCKSGEELQANL